jgi:hypothetical protein
VRIRSRKPCVRARRRLFGWKVRLPLLTSRLSRSTARCWAGRRSALGLDGYALLPRRHASRHTGHRVETTCEPPAYAAAREPVKRPSPPRRMRQADACGPCRVSISVRLLTVWIRGDRPDLERLELGAREISSRGPRVPSCAQVWTGLGMDCAQTTCRGRRQVRPP